jgi:hypothetical protein
MQWGLAKVAVGIVATAAIAQENAPAGFLKGTFVSWAGSPRSGRFVFETAVNQLYSCSFDDKTYIERENRRVAISAAEKGDRLELVSDHKPDAVTCYTRVLHIIDPPRTYLMPGVRPRPRAARPVEPLRPRGDMTVSGIVLRVSSDLLTLKSRSGEQQTILLRPDTRYSTEGQTAEAGNLRVNTLVFVRCGKNIEDQVEAYHVVWGEILQPQE